MSAPLIPQEIYVLERYSSLEYFAAMRDAWDAMVGHVEQSLERFMQKLPPAYRNRPLPEQPDIVWGQRVLPNFQHTQREVHDAYAELLSGNMNGLNAAHNVSNDIRGQREFSDAWLDEVEDGGAANATPSCCRRPGTMHVTSPQRPGPTGMWARLESDMSSSAAVRSIHPLHGRSIG